MFPDPTIEWQLYPSVIDGIGLPYVLDRGLWRGVLNLIVVEAKPGNRAYGVQIDCEAYGAFTDMIYSVAQHGDALGTYDGGTYIKEARTSRLLTDFKRIDPLDRQARHFLFVSADFCYETLGFAEPQIQAFTNGDEAYRWQPGQQHPCLSDVT